MLCRLLLHPDDRLLLHAHVGLPGSGIGGRSTIVPVSRPGHRLLPASASASARESHSATTLRTPVPLPVTIPDLTTTTTHPDAARIGMAPLAAPVEGWVVSPPPVYPPPPPPAIGGVPADRTWNLVLSSGARKLVVVFFILGALGIIAYTTFFIARDKVATSNQAITAQNQVVSDYSTAVVAVQSFSTTAKGCNQLSGSPTAQVACLETNDAKLAKAFDHFASALSVIDYPSSVSTEASAAQAAASQAGSTMHQLADAGATASAYNVVVNSSNTQSVFTQVDTTFRRLNSVLINR